MKPPTPVPLVRDYLRILARYWLVILCTTALSVGAGWLARRDTAPQYAASVRVFAATVGSAAVFDAYNGNEDALESAASVVQLARNPQVAKRTIDQLDLHQTPADLLRRITPVARGAVVEIYITGVPGDSPELVRDTANSVLFNLQALAREMGDLNTSSIQLLSIDLAGGVSDQRPPLQKYLFLGGLLGLGLSALLVIALGRAEDSLLSQDQVARTVDEAAAGMNA